MKKILYPAIVLFLAACSNPPQPAVTEEKKDTVATTTTPPVTTETPKNNTVAPETEKSTAAVVPVSEDEINRVLDLFERSGVKMIRNDKSMSSKEAAKLLKGKYLSAKSKVSTWEDFIREVATSSTQSGKPYMVEAPGSNVVSLSEYLTALHSR